MRRAPGGTNLMPVNIAAPVHPLCPMTVTDTAASPGEEGFVHLLTSPRALPGPPRFRHTLAGLVERGSRDPPTLLRIALKRRAGGGAAEALATHQPALLNARSLPRNGLAKHTSVEHG